MGKGRRYSSPTQLNSRLKNSSAFLVPQSELWRFRSGYHCGTPSRTELITTRVENDNGRNGVVLYCRVIAAGSPTVTSRVKLYNGLRTGLMTYIGIHTNSRSIPAEHRYPLTATAPPLTSSGFPHSLLLLIIPLERATTNEEQPDANCVSSNQPARRISIPPIPNDFLNVHWGWGRVTVDGVWAPAEKNPSLPPPKGQKKGKTERQAWNIRILTWSSS